MKTRYPSVQMSSLGVLALGSLALTACGNGDGQPELGDILDSVESSMKAQDSVAYSGDVNLEEDPTGGAMTVPGAERAELTTEIEGEVQGIARMDVDYGVVMDRALLYEGQIYASGETLADWEDADPYPGFDNDAFRADAEGLWFDVTEELAHDPHYFSSIEEAFDNVFSELRDAGLEDAPWESEAGEHNGQDAWIYTFGDDEGSAEIITTADEDEPLLLRYAVNLDDGAQHVEIDFSDWNEAEVPEAPAEDSLRTMADLQELYAEHDSGGW